MPDYRIMLWTYEMAEATEILYVKEALEQKKWAFAADVIRLYALYKYGGVYFDSDIFLKRKIDILLTDSFISTMEYHCRVVDFSTIDENGYRIAPIDTAIPGIGIQAAFMASVPKHHFVKVLLDYYTCRHFKKADGTLDVAIIAPAHYAINAEKYGFRYLDVEQKLENMTLYRSCYLAGCIVEDNRRALAVHCCNHSWADRTIWEKWKYRVINSLFLVKMFYYNSFFK